MFINPSSRQRQLESSFIKTLFESKNVKKYDLLLFKAACSALYI